MVTICICYLFKIKCLHTKLVKCGFFWLEQNKGAELAKVKNVSVAFFHSRVFYRILENFVSMEP